MDDAKAKKMMALEHVGIGVAVSVIVAVAFYLGMKVGLKACI